MRDRTYSCCSVVTLLRHGFFVHIFGTDCLVTDLCLLGLSPERQDLAPMSGTLIFALTLGALIFAPGVALSRVLGAPTFARQISILRCSSFCANFAFSSIGASNIAVPHAQIARNLAEFSAACQ